MIFLMKKYIIKITKNLFNKKLYTKGFQEKTFKIKKFLFIFSFNNIIFLILK